MMVEKKLPGKSRREKRKEARTVKKQNKYQSWVEHQGSQKLKKASVASNSANVETENDCKEVTDSDGNMSLDHFNLQENAKIEDEILLDHDSPARKLRKGKKSVKKNAKTKFEEYLEKDVQIVSASAKEDLELERKLAKKLKVKEGKLRGSDDGLNMLFEGLPSIIDTFNQEASVAEEDLKGDCKRSSGKKSKRQKSLKHASDGVQTVDSDEEISNPEVTYCEDVQLEDVRTTVQPTKKRKKRDMLKDDSALGPSQTMEVSGAELPVQEVPSKAGPPQVNAKYVAPHLRSRAPESEEHTQLRRRIRGLLNRLSESNVESITGEMATIYQSVVRSIGTQIISEEVLASCAGGPRGNEQYAAVFAAFVAGLACSVGVDFSAKLLASLAKCFEDQYLKEDNLSLRNLTLLLSYLCIFGVCSSDLIYDFLNMLSKRLMEIDVSTILTILQCCGMKIRGDDPTAMKNFIVSIQSKVNELKASPKDGQTVINNKRMEFMLETICDIKNNKKRTKEDSVQQTRIKKWLQKLRVEDILIRGIKWSRLLDPNKRGQWWLSGDLASTTENVAEVASRIDKEVLEAQKMLQLAATQRMNTDARRAIFCIIMTGDDYVDAFEKLLRLDLPGKQDREIIRILVDCCLQEKVFNKYYTVLASKLCEHDKNHKFTLQFCLWDHFKEVESMQLQRSMHLAEFVAEMVTSFTLSLAVLKTVDFTDSTQMTPKRIMHFRMLFETLLENPEKTVWNVFTRVAVVPELEALRHGIEFFIKEYVVNNNKKTFTPKFKVVKKAFNNVEGVLM